MPPADRWCAADATEFTSVVAATAIKLPRVSDERLPSTLLRDALGAWSHLGLGSDDVGIEAIPPGATADVFLVTQRGRRWVAKYTYAARGYVDAGLQVSKVVADRLDVAVTVPVPTDEGADTVLVEWPRGEEHPLALLTFVDGDPLRSDEPDVQEVVGGVCGRVHDCLLYVDPATVGLSRDDDAVPAIHDHWDLGRYRWLDDVYVGLRELAMNAAAQVRHTVAVWDGPDIRRAPDGSIGLIDFGHTGWYPLPHAVASRSLGPAHADRSLYERFLAAVETHLPLTIEERESMDVFRLLNATIYARWSVSHVTPDTSRWAQELLLFLRTDLPRVGLSLPAAADR